MHLVQRLFAFSLSEGEELKIDTQKYRVLLQNFCEKLKNNNKLFYESKTKYDAIGDFITGDHLTWLSDLSEILESKTKMILHEIACKDAENLFSNVEKNIKKQLIAYLDTKTTRDLLNESNFFYGYENILNRTWAKLTKADQQRFTDRSGNNDRLAALKYYVQNNGGYNTARITTLIQALEVAAGTRGMVEAVRIFIKNSGWTGLLSGQVQCLP